MTERSHHVCPFWFGYFLAMPWRRYAHDPQRLLTPHVSAGMTVLDVGCAMGFFSLPLARMVGPAGRVVCVDVQERMLREVERRAVKAGLRERLDTRPCTSDSLGLEGLAGAVDFALAFFVVHEVPDPQRLFAQVRQALKPGGGLLFAEPSGHIGAPAFARELDAARAAGLEIAGEPRVRRSRAALLRAPAARA